MTKAQVVLRIREKLAKLHTYHTMAVKLWGDTIASEMYKEDLDFYVSLLVMLGETKE